MVKHAPYDQLTRQLIKYSEAQLEVDKKYNPQTYVTHVGFNNAKYALTCTSSTDVVMDWIVAHLNENDFIGFDVEADPRNGVINSMQMATTSNVIVFHGPLVPRNQFWIYEMLASRNITTCVWDS
jgi:hypothetical protein